VSTCAARCLTPVDVTSMLATVSSVTVVTPGYNITSTHSPKKCFFLFETPVNFIVYKKMKCFCVCTFLFQILQLMPQRKIILESRNLAKH
jgi:hypothetical protein